MTDFRAVGEWTLDGHLASARQARALVREALAVRSALTETELEDVELVASELVVNAAEHGEGAIDLALDLAPGVVRVTVTSGAGTGEPEVRPHSKEAGGGRGLALVEGLAESWGWRRVGDRIAVWAQFNVGDE